MAAIKSYSAKDIKSFDHDVDKVRMRPSQYMGEKGDDMVLTVVREPIDNIVDEHLAGRGNVMHVFYDPKTRIVSVVDEGHGIPTEERKVHGKPVSTLTVVFTQLQSGGKFESGAYEATRGTHGVGVTATNALSEWLKVWTTYKGKVVSQKFIKGKPIGKPAPDKLPTFGTGEFAHKMAKKGTAVQFLPDQSVVGKGAMLSIPALVKMLDTTAYLNSKLKITLTVEGKGQKVFQHKGGLADYLQHRIKKMDVGVLGKPCAIVGDKFDVAFQFTDYDGDDEFLGYTNSLPNKDGGSHIDLFRNSLYKVLKDFAGARAKPFSEKDLRDGLVGLIDFKLQGPTFSGQTKEKLTDSRVKDSKDTLEKQLKKFFDANKSLAKDIITRAGDLKALKDEQLKDKRALKGLKQNRNGSKLPPANKLTTSTAKADVRELFLVEGDSAGGRAKYARFPWQEVYKMRGKLLNVARDAKGKIFEGDPDKNEAMLILRSIGFDPNLDDPYSKLRVSKIISLCDPDPDGAHIATLLAALQHKYLRPLFERGMFYVCNAKEYVAEYKGQYYMGDSPEEARKNLPKEAPKSTAVSHIKGWGEVDDELLRELAFNPSTRKMIQLNGVTKDDHKRFLALMTEDTEYRKRLLNIKV